jgi:hypothetical protein
VGAGHNWYIRIRKSNQPSKPTCVHEEPAVYGKREPYKKKLDKNSFEVAYECLMTYYHKLKNMR